MTDIRSLHPPAVRQGTAYHLRKALGSFATSRREVAFAFAGLAIASALPGATVPTLAAGTALLGIHLAAVRGRTPRLPRSWKEARLLFGKRSNDKDLSVTLATDDDGRPFVLDSDQVRQHILMLGPKAARQDALLSLCEQMADHSSGFMFCDALGDVTSYARVHDMARRIGREDDLLVLNLMTANSEPKPGTLLSHTLNPFATGSPDSLAQIVISLMDDVGGDGAMWKARATALFTGLMRALAWNRDQGMVDLNVGVIRDHLNLRHIVELCDPDQYPGMPEHIRTSMRSYLTSLPGYQEERRHRQSQVTLDQHGYLEMKFTKILGSLADVYGHIFKVTVPDIDLTDVVTNRRILVVMLPALEKSGDELANLGKIVVATLRNTMAAAHLRKIEGSWDEVIDSRGSFFSSNPFMCALNEAGHYTIEGMALMAAQARALGFSMVYASEDVPAMKRLNEKEAASMIANTNTKMFLGREGSADVTVFRHDLVIQGTIKPPLPLPGNRSPRTNHLVVIRPPVKNK